jgi:hypothetical protein
MDSQFCSPSITKLAKALIKVQQLLQPALKDADNPFTKSRYASLNSVMDSCRDALIQNGIWLTQFPVPVESGCLGLVTKLTHAESGEWQSSLAVVPLPKADPQGVGISMTYMRRYALSAMLGIVTEEDTDGEMPKNKPSAQLNTARPSKQPTNSPQMQKVPPQRISQANNNSTASNRNSGASKNLPQLAGIAYERVQGQDGQNYILAKGETIPHKETLISAGFQWNPQRKVWWKCAA